MDKTDQLRNSVVDYEKQDEVITAEHRVVEHKNKPYFQAKIDCNPFNGLVNGFTFFFRKD